MSSHRFLKSDGDVSAQTAGRLVIYTDGSCINNGKANPSAGIGIFIPEASLSYCSKLDKSHNQTNQRAELEAVRMAMVLTHSDPRNLEIIVDSHYVMNGLTDWSVTWIKNKWQKQLDNGDLFKAIIDLAEIQRRQVYLRAVLGHTGDQGNTVADSLANLAARK